MALGRAFPFRPHLALQYQLAVPAQPPLPPGRIVSQALQRSQERRYRDVPPAPHVAKPVIGIMPPFPSIQMDQAAKRNYYDLAGRFNPFPAHLAPAIVPRAPPAAKLVLFLQARNNSFYVRLVHSRLPKRGPHGPFAPPIVVSQALARTSSELLGRIQQFRPHVAQPVIGYKQPFAPSVVVNQTLARTSSELLGRTQQFRPHLAQAVVPHGPVVPPAVLVDQAVQRSQAQEASRGRFLPFPAKVAKPIVSPLPAPAATIVSETSQYRAKVGRGAPSFTVQWAGTQPPSAPAFVVSVARPNALIGRQVPRAHLAAPLIGQPFVVSSLIVQQAVKGASELQIRFAPPRPHVARPVLAPAPRVVVPIVSGVAVRRAFGRTVPYRARLAPSLAIPQIEAYVPSIAVFHALELPKPLRQPIRAHLAGPILTVPAQHITVGATIVAPPFVGNARRGINPPHLAKPIIISAGPGSRIVSQAVARAPIGRSPRTLKLAPALMVGVGAKQLIVGQALRRAVTARTVPLKARTAYPVVKPLQTPVAAARIVLAHAPVVASRVFPAHVAQRTLVGRGPGITQTSQAVQRSQERRFRDVVAAPKTAKPILLQQPAGATIKLAAQARQLVRRSGHVLLPPTSPPAVVRPGTFVSQALQRPKVGRQVPRVHTANPVSFFVAQVGTFVSQAIRRPLFRRATPMAHLAPPVVLPPQPPVKPGLFVSQRLENLLRPRDGRTSVYAKPIVSPFNPVISSPGVVAPISLAGVVAPTELPGIDSA